MACVKNLFVSGVALVAFAGAAAAADLPLKTPAAVVASNWDGLYAGIHAGYGWSAGSTRYDPIDPLGLGTAFNQTIGLLPTSLPAGMHGFVGGGQLGYNWLSGRALVGIETDISYAGMGRDVTVAAPAINGLPMTTSQSKRLEWFGTVRGRLGWLYGPATLLYATGGLAYGGARASTVVDVPIPQTCPSLNSFCSADSASAVLVGWTVGGGVEAAIASNWTAKVEYLYFDLGHLSYTDFSSVGFITGFAPGTYPNFQTTTDFRGHIVRVGLNYAFH